MIWVALGSLAVTGWCLYRLLDSWVTLGQQKERIVWLEKKVEDMVQQMDTGGFIQALERVRKRQKEGV